MLLLTLPLAACEPASPVVSLELEADVGSGEPHLALSSAGEVVLSFLEIDGDATALRYTVLNAQHWHPPKTVARGTHWMVNWADFPSVVPLANGVWAAHWLVKTPGGHYAYDVMVSQSTDAGQTWSAPVSPHHDGTLTEHGFVSLFPIDDKVGVVWLDGRDYASATKGDQDPAFTALRTAALDRQQALSSEGVVDGAVCDCCQTDIAIAGSGPVVVYRNRTREEIRDIYFSRYIEGQWQPGAVVSKDNWQITGCPVNGPAISALDQTVAVAWFTASPEARIQLAFSTDSAETFGSAINVSAVSPLGRVDVVMLADGDAMVSWLESKPSGRLVARRVSVDGQLGSIQEVAPMAIERNSGFPQMVTSGDRLIFAWTDVAESSSVVKTAYLALEHTGSGAR